MFSRFKKKEPFLTVACKGVRLAGHAARALLVKELDLPAMVKKIDSSEVCSQISFGKIYQKAGSMLEENNIEDQGYHASYDKVTKSLGLNLRQGNMRQTLVLSTREPALLCAELGITLDLGTPTEPTAS